MGSAALEATLPILVLLLILGVATAGALVVCREDERAVVYRLGRRLGVRGPGLFATLPLLDRIVRVSLGPQSVSVDASPLTRDGAGLTIGVSVHFRVTDPARADEAGDYRELVAGSARTALVAAVGQLGQADVLAARERVGERVRQVLDQQADAWGIRVTGVELGRLEASGAARVASS